MPRIPSTSTPPPPPPPPQYTLTAYEPTLRTLLKALPLLAHNNALTPAEKGELKALTLYLAAKLPRDRRP